MRIVVPSGSLRRHVCSRLVRRRPSALVGVQVDSLPGIAYEILDRSGMTRGYDFPLDILVARELVHEKALKSIPGSSAGSATATVRDFLDAGLEADHMQALEALLEGRMVGISDSERARALGLMRVAVRIRQTIEAEPFRLDGSDLLKAAECLTRVPSHDSILCRSVIIFGFSDVTGAAGELLSVLLRRFGGTAIVDLPPNPGDGKTREDAYPSELKTRFAASAGPQSPGSSLENTQLSLFVAGEPWIEVHTLADRVREELRAGTEPEEIAIAFRDPENYRLEIRRLFTRLGIPYSATAISGPNHPRLRPWRAMLDLIERDLDPASERWLSALHPTASSPSEAELALAIRVMGTGRLSALAELAPRSSDLPLPMRHGLVDPKTGSPGGPSSPRAHLSTDALDRLRQMAAATRDLLGAWPSPAPFFSHLTQLDELAGALGWPEIPQDLLYALAKSVPRDLDLSRSEFRKVAEAALATLQPEALGGRGGGVQILSVMEARSRRFSRLFVAGMQRGAFPRSIREDPLLSDALRKQIRSLLPDLPIKSLGHDEERYLFAQLLTAAPRVTLSWSHRVDSKDQLPSPLLESLLRVRNDLEVEAVEPPMGTSQTARPFEDHLMTMALGKDPEALKIHLAQAWPQLAAELPGDMDPREISARLDLLAISHASFAHRESASPFLGFIGPVRSSTDPRRRALAVTTVERFIACPWQTFLTRFLHLEAPPDPFANLPSLDSLKLGNVVHHTLEAVSRDRPVQERETGKIPWPSAKDLERLAFTEAEKLLREEGSSMEGLARGLAHLALPFLEVARQVDWPEGLSRNSVVGVEMRGQVADDPNFGDAALEFRADRVDRLEQGLLRTDYKTGKPLSEAKQETTRHRHLSLAVLQGRSLQIVAYCLTGDRQPVEGRLLYLGEGVQDDHRSIQVTQDDQDLIEAYRESVAAAVDALRSGTLFPRLTGPDGQKEPSQCSYCSVRDACLRGDSSARRQLLGIVEKAGRPSATSSRAEALSSLVSLWQLPDRKQPNS